MTESSLKHIFTYTNKGGKKSIMTHKDEMVDSPLFMKEYTNDE